MNFSGISNLTGLNKGAQAAQIAAVESAMKVKLPSAYKDLLSYSDGVLLENGLSLYQLQDLAERNETYEVKDYCDGYLLIGDDSGGKGFLIKLEKDDPSVFESGLGDLDPSDFSSIAVNLQEWISRGLRA
ncbi:SMI1/KNR4 family protein [Burkholderia sp. Ac-20365]|uniref:SMI1/KNR4 family protein n=1 Tax=Burkholderia sp. Ac-20365 TaxID=2703897 RepID=UPI00197C5B9A|nr:SMI1/KNR4 family protein [Burkholderia sp. Ac-20365]MBN3767633.1 SMI1/KNR4 family protein [Burkholderia sp. Ac-20365]